MSLIKLASEVLSALRSRAAARQRWLAILDGDDGDPQEARQQHLAADDRFESVLQQFVEFVQSGQAAGLVQIELEELEPEDRRTLAGLLAERGLDSLLSDEGFSSLSQLVSAWRQASCALTVARRLNEVRLACDSDSFEAAVAAEKERFEDSNSFDLAVRMLERFIKTADGDLGDATHLNIRFWLKRYDSLTETLADTVEPLTSSGQLKAELEELDFGNRRALLAAIDGGLLPQLAPQTSTKPQSRPVTVI
ncbi:MAG: hypothetical protein AB7W16_10320 [Candidatus Obscuribacterales bacterium]